MAKSLSAYNRFVRTFAKTYKGKALMKAAGIAWRAKKRGKTTKSASKRSTSKGRKNVSRKGKLFGSISGIGALEDLAVGLGGGVLFRSMGQGANAVPMTRIVQGAVGYGLKRRGKAHLIRGIIDYVDNYLLSRIGYGVRPGAKTVTVPSVAGLLRLFQR